MASRLRSVSRPAATFIRSSAAARRATSTPHTASLPRIPRPVGGGRQTGLAGSLQPLHSSVSAARLTSRLGPGEAGVACVMSQGTVCISYPGV